jgi:hypothetical protein
MSEREEHSVDLERLIKGCKKLVEVCETTQQCSEDLKRALREVCESLEEGRKRVYATVGFMATESRSKRFIDELCDILFKVHRIESPTKDSDKYLSECLELSLKEEAVREIFYLYGLLYHHYAIHRLASILQSLEEENNPVED